MNNIFSAEETIKQINNYVTNIKSDITKKSSMSGSVLILFDKSVNYFTNNDAFLTAREHTSNNTKLLPYGWMINSPHYNHALHTLGILDGNDLLRSMVNNDRIYIVHGIMKKQRETHVKLLEMYLSRHIRPREDIRLIPRYDYCTPGGVGFVFYNVVSLPCDGNMNN